MDTFEQMFAKSVEMRNNRSKTEKEKEIERNKIVENNKKLLSKLKIGQVFMIVDPKSSLFNAKGIIRNMAQDVDCTITEYSGGQVVSQGYSIKLRLNNPSYFLNCFFYYHRSLHSI